MQKKFLIILMCALLLVLTGCGKEESKFTVEGESRTEIETKKDVVLSVKKGSLSKEGVTLILKNNSKDDYEYSNLYELEIKQDGKWHKIDVEVDPNSPSFDLKAGKSAEVSINWKSTYGKLGKGKYRIIKDIDYEYDEDVYGVFNVAVEFEIA